MQLAVGGVETELEIKMIQADYEIGTNKPRLERFNLPKFTDLAKKGAEEWVNVMKKVNDDIFEQKEFVRMEGRFEPSSGL